MTLTQNYFRRRIPIEEHIFCFWHFLITSIFKFTLLLKWYPIFDSSPQNQFSKFNNFVCVCWFSGKNLSDFITPAWKLDNPYYHNPDVHFHHVRYCTGSITLLVFDYLSDFFLCTIIQTPLPKKRPNFWQISVLASKLGQIKNTHTPSPRVTRIFVS
jgi:hypothetical protein